MKHNTVSRAVDVRDAAPDKARNLFLLAALISFLLSVSLWFTGSREQGLFVGIWVPSILALGTLMLGRGEGR